MLVLFDLCRMLFAFGFQCLFDLGGDQFFQSLYRPDLVAEKLAGRLNGFAVRVPMPTGSLTGSRMATRPRAGRRTRSPRECSAVITLRCAIRP